MLNSEITKPCHWFWIFPVTAAFLLAAILFVLVFFCKPNFSENIKEQETVCRENDSVPSCIIGANCQKSEEYNLDCRQCKPKISVIFKKTNWASCIVFSVGIVCITLFFIIICFFYQKFLIQKDKIILLENLENELLKENFNLDCKYELSKRITSAITEI